MIEISKGDRHLTIPAGALKQYVSAGWEPTEIGHQKEIKATDEPKMENSGNEKYVEEVDEDEEVIYVDPEELMLKPLSELDKEELVILAEYKGLDTSKLKTMKQLRDAIRSIE